MMVNKDKEIQKRQEKVINDFLRTIAPLTEKLTHEENVFLWTNLKCLYAVGLWDGRAQISRRRTVYKMKNGVIFERYPSVTKAARSEGMDKRTMSVRIRKGQIDENGFTFKLK
jgi:hypothetical protein